MKRYLNFYTDNILDSRHIQVLSKAKNFSVLKDDEVIFRINPEPESLDKERKYYNISLGNLDNEYKTISSEQILKNAGAITILTEFFNSLVMDKTDFKYRIVSCLKDVTDFIDSSNSFALDIEISGNLGDDPRFSNPIISISLNNGIESIIVPEHLCENRDILTTILESIYTKKVYCHNGKFDIQYMCMRAGVPYIKYSDDTMLMSYTINPGTREHGLKELCKRIFNAPDWELETKKYTKKGAHYEYIPKRYLYLYNAYDTFYTFRLGEYLEKIISNEPQYYFLYKYLRQVNHMLAEIEINGVHVDKEYVENLDYEFKEKMLSLARELKNIAGSNDFNPNSPKQILGFFRSIGANHIKSTGKDYLETVYGFNDFCDKFLDILIEYRKVAKLRNSYTATLSKIIDDKGRVYPTYLTHGSITGRLSAKKPPIQTMPRGYGIKKIFTACPGMKIVAADYSQAELRVVAVLSGDENMIEAFSIASPDFFDDLMTKVYPEYFKTVKDVKEYYNTDPKKYKELRTLVKSVVYGSNYGRSVGSIAKALKISTNDASNVMHNYYKTYPKLKLWQDSIKKDFRTRSLTTIFNRRFQCEVITAENAYSVKNSALSFMPQSTANDICLKAALQVHSKIGLFGGKIVGLVHDCIYTEVPICNVDKVCEMLKNEMELSGRLFTNDLVFAAEPDVGNNWEEV